MSNTGLWPRERPRSKNSHLVESLRRAFPQLPANWTARLSLRIRTNEGFEGEDDYTLALPGRRQKVLQNMYFDYRLKARISRSARYPFMFARGSTVTEKPECAR